MKCSLGISNFPKEISSLSQSIAFLYFFALISEEEKKNLWGRLSYLSLLFFGTLHSNRHMFPFLLCLSLLFSAVCQASPDSHFGVLHFFSMGMVLLPASCTVSRTSVHSSSATLPIRSSPLNLVVTPAVKPWGIWLRSPWVVWYPFVLLQRNATRWQHIPKSSLSASSSGSSCAEAGGPQI